VSPASSWPNQPSRPPASGGAARQVEQLRTRDTDEAEHIVTETYRPHRLWVTDAQNLDFDIRRARFGQTIAGLLSYGHPVQLHTVELTDFHLNLTLQGRAASTSGRSGPLGPLITVPGQAVIFKVGEPAHMTLSADCRRLSLMAPRARVEEELERLLGRSLPDPLQFEEAIRTEVGELWKPAVQLVIEELDRGSGILTLPGVSDHLEGLLIDGLLLAQGHNYRELVFRETPPGPSGAIARAAELLQELPGEPWTVVRLAQRVSLSVRALQYGFRRDFDLSPMAYLRRVRLQQAHRLLLAGSPNDVTVRGVAIQCGLMHLGRFAHGYRQMFGESPSDTLVRRL
jgi:AraC-like DNA-binding protein